MFFLTGQGGTGKTATLSKVISELKQLHEALSVAVTVMTGIASKHLGGVTIHSWLGIGLGLGNRYQLLNKVLANREAAERIANTEVLILDEVSMLTR